MRQTRAGASSLAGSPRWQGCMCSDIETLTLSGDSRLQGLPGSGSSLVGSRHTSVPRRFHPRLQPLPVACEFESRRVVSRRSALQHPPEPAQGSRPRQSPEACDRPRRRSAVRRVPKMHDSCGRQHRYGEDRQAQYGQHKREQQLESLLVLLPRHGEQLCPVFSRTCAFIECRSRTLQPGIQAQK